MKNYGSNTIEQKKKKLDDLIKGPPEVQAQRYDKIVRASGDVENVKEILKEIEETVAEINKFEEQLAEKKKNKLELEKIVCKCLELNPRNLELRVFYHRHIKNESLKKIHKRLRRFNAYGEKVRYNYDYIRQINSRIIAKMTDPEEKL